MGKLKTSAQSWLGAQIRESAVPGFWNILCRSWEDKQTGPVQAFTCLSPKYWGSCPAGCCVHYAPPTNRVLPYHPHLGSAKHSIPRGTSKSKGWTLALCKKQGRKKNGQKAKECHLSQRVTWGTFVWSLCKEKTEAAMICMEERKDTEGPCRNQQKLGTESMTLHPPP